jgi:hypothetical protein
MQEAIEKAVQEAAELVVHDTFPSMDVACSLRYTEQATKTLRSLALKVREMTLDDCVEKVDLAAHECWKNVAHEEYMNRIENAAQYDILRGEFKKLAAELRRMKGETCK